MKNWQQHLPAKQSGKAYSNAAYDYSAQKHGWIRCKSSFVGDSLGNVNFGHRGGCSYGRYDSTQCGSCQEKAPKRAMLVVDIYDLCHTRPQTNTCKMRADL